MPPAVLAPAPPTPAPPRAEPKPPDGDRPLSSAEILLARRKKRGP
jgi:hypothetical protein